jgi:hypothetical protein
VPAAVPETLSPPAHVALNDPMAAVGDICVGVHLKFVQLDGGGTTLVDADVQVPTSASTVDVVGLLGVVVLLSYPTHPAAAAHAAIAHAKMECFMGSGFRRGGPNCTISTCRS